MTQADRIREFVRDRYVAPARIDGRAQITIRAGDVHRAMSLVQAMPAVCSAIGSKKFVEIAGVTPINRIGPAHGANVWFTFGVTRPVPQRAKVQRAEPIHAPQLLRGRSLDLKGAVVLVSCVKSKLSGSAPARTLYTSPWFRKVRHIVEKSGARWFVLSARHGLVAPDDEIAPYDHTLNAMGLAERKEWASHVLDKLFPQLSNEKRVVVFAGRRYREFLVEPLRQRGIEVQVPMADLARGKQLAWLSDLE
jgi:hypothetical protein